MTNYDAHQQSLNELLPIAKQLYADLIYSNKRTQAMAEYEMFDTRYRLRFNRTVMQQIEALPPYDWQSDIQVSADLGSDEGGVEYIDTDPGIDSMRVFDQDREAKIEAARNRHPANNLQDPPPPSNAPHLRAVRDDDVAESIRVAAAKAHVDAIRQNTDDETS